MWAKGFGTAALCAFALPAAGPGALAADRRPLPTIDGRPAACAVDGVEAPAETAATQSRGVSVTVPRYTYVDERSATTRVWTNTDAKPSRRDAFVVLTAGAWHAASPSLVDEILALCG